MLKQMPKTTASAAKKRALVNDFKTGLSASDWMAVAWEVQHALLTITLFSSVTYSPNPASKIPPS